MNKYNYFLHNASSVIFKSRLTDEEYTHFMHYLCAMTLFNSQEYVEHWPYARELWRQYVIDFPSVYDLTLVSANVHNQIHVFDDVNRFGPLHTSSAYPFEAFLKKIKKILRSGKNCLKQAVNILFE